MSKRNWDKFIEEVMEELATGLYRQERKAALARGVPRNVADELATHVTAQLYPATIARL